MDVWDDYECEGQLNFFDKEVDRNYRLEQEMSKEDIELVDSIMDRVTDLADGILGMDLNSSRLEDNIYEMFEVMGEWDEYKERYQEK